MFLLALLSFILVLFAITRARLIKGWVATLMSRVEFNLNPFDGLSNDDVNKVKFLIWSGLSVNTFFSAWLYLISGVWEVLVDDKVFEIGIIFIFLMIMALGGILLSRAVKSLMALEKKDV